jgi:hypothetical protein
MEWRTKIARPPGHSDSVFFSAAGLESNLTELAVLYFGTRVISAAGENWAMRARIEDSETWENK